MRRPMRRIVLFAAAWLCPAPAVAGGRLAVPAPPPDAPPVLRDVVGPALRALGPGGGWEPMPVDATQGDPAALARTLDVAGVLWATAGPDGPVLHLYRRIDDRTLDVALPLPADADAAAAREAVRLRAAFLLEAPAGMGRPAGPPPGRALPPIPPERHRELATPAGPAPPPLPPPGLPDPPPPLPVEAPATAPEVQVTVREGDAASTPPAQPARGLRAFVGPALLADGDHVEPGLAAGVSRIGGAGWGGRVGVGAFPLRAEDDVRVTTLRLGAAAGWSSTAADARFAVFAGPLAERLSTADASAWRAACEIGAAAALSVSGPLELAVGLDLAGSPADLEAAGQRLGRVALAAHLSLGVRVLP